MLSPLGEGVGRLPQDFGDRGAIRWLDALAESHSDGLAARQLRGPAASRMAAIPCRSERRRGFGEQFVYLEGFGEDRLNPAFGWVLGNRRAVAGDHDDRDGAIQAQRSQRLLPHQIACLRSVERRIEVGHDESAAGILEVLGGLVHGCDRSRLVARFRKNLGYQVSDCLVIFDDQYKTVHVHLSIGGATDPRPRPESP